MLACCSKIIVDLSLYFLGITLSSLLIWMPFAVAGIIGAEGNNGIGVAGINWKISLRPCKFLDADGGGYMSDAIECMEWALAIGAKISSNSWGGGGFSQAFSSILDVARDEGHLFVAAAGNIRSPSEAEQSCPFYPAA